MDIKQLKEEINKLLDQVDNKSEIEELKLKINQLEQRIASIEEQLNFINIGFVKSPHDYINTCLDSPNAINIPTFVALTGSN